MHDVYSTVLISLVAMFALIGVAGCVESRSFNTIDFVERESVELSQQDGAPHPEHTVLPREDVVPAEQRPRVDSSYDRCDAYAKSHLSCDLGTIFVFQNRYSAKYPEIGVAVEDLVALKRKCYTPLAERLTTSLSRLP